MIQTWSGVKPKYKAADDLIIRLMDSVYAVNKNVEFSLRVFGHQHTVAENNCYDTKNEVPFSHDNRDQMALRLADIHPLGVTPIAYALQQAAENDITDETHNAYSIILITDGGESCGGDICQVIKTLIRDKVYFKPYIVSLEDDPSLRTTYSCMGDFLQVTKEDQMGTAVSTIVTAFRPAIKISASEYKQMQDIAANAPSILKVSVPVVPKVEKKDSVALPPPMKTWKTPVGANITPIQPMGPRTLVTDRIVSEQVEAIANKNKLPEVKTEAPVKPDVLKIPALAAAPQRGFHTAAPEAGVARPVANNIKLPEVKVDTPRPSLAIAALRPAPPRTFLKLWVTEEKSIATRPVPPLPPIKQEWLPKPNPALDKGGDYVEKTEDASETSLMVYFTNGQGVYYPTTPQVLLIDPISKKTVKRFYRTVDADGNPDPQTTIVPGTYNLSFANNTKFVLTGVTVVANKKNSVTVTVHPATLSFAYKDAPNRPVTEFTAVVTERNKANGRVQEQKCTESLQYEPGNYHVEINTFPKDIRNIPDMDFDYETVISIPQPGFAKFTTDGSVRVVSLFQRLGDKFLAFYTLDLNDPRSQHLQIQPGEYQVHYQRGPVHSNATEQVKQFNIKPTETTEIMLN
jgi:hypothetical protein